jgi:hypothetical protein
MNLKDYFNSIKYTDIQSFIEDKKKEDIFFEFKTANYPDKVDFDKKNFSRCLSAFANSAGGIIVWGISTQSVHGKYDVASKLKPLTDLLGFESYLMKIEHDAIIPSIEGVEYRRIIENDNSGFLLVFVPPSSRAPHMALFADKRYYKRNADNCYVCEHFDIMDMLNRKTAPDLNVILKNVKIEDRYRFAKPVKSFEGIICVENISAVSAQHVYLSLNISTPFKVSTFALDGNGSPGMDRRNNSYVNVSYSGGYNVVIHPTMIYEIDKIVLREEVETQVIPELRIDYTIICEGMNLKTGQIIYSGENSLEIIENQSKNILK